MKETLESNIALLVDFDNIAISTEQAKLGRFDIEAVVKELRDRGRLIVKRAYADWKKWGGFQSALLSNAIDMVHVPSHGGSNKNNADIRMAVDAMEIVYRNPLIDTFVIASGDSDFQGLVTKLRENGKYVITIGVKECTSNLLIYSSDEFLSYESLVGRGGARSAEEGFRLLQEVLRSVVQEEMVSLFSVKNLLLRKDPSFNEKEFGFKRFKQFVLAAEDRGYIRVEQDGREMFLEVVEEGEEERSGPQLERAKRGRRRQ